MKSVFDFIEELNERWTDTISVFDVDDTLVFSDNKIGIKEPGKPIYWVPTDEFAEVRTNLPSGTGFDFSQFSQYKSTFAGITHGKPNTHILKILSESIQKGHKIGIITARGNQHAVYYALKNFLRYEDELGKSHPLPEGQFNKTFVFAVGGDHPLQLPQFSNEVGSTNDPSKIKSIILQRIFGDTMGFHKIYFYDDDQGNIDKVEALDDPRIFPILVKNSCPDCN